MSDSSASDSRMTPAPCEQRHECLLLEIKEKLDDLIYKEQVNQLWKVGMESMMYSVWAKVCTHYITVSVSCQTDEQAEQLCDPSPGKCATCLHGTVICPSEEESGLGFGTEEDSEQNSEGNPAKRSLEENFSSRVNEGDGCDVSVPVGCSSLVEDGSSPFVVADARPKESSQPDSGSRSENMESYQCESKFSRKRSQRDVVSSWRRLIVDKFSRHQRANLNSIERHKCQLCLRVFKNRLGLTNHTKGRACPRKPGKSLFKCLECGKSFNTEDTFYRHLLCHKEKKLVCTVCDKAFHFQSTLNKHMRSHTGERPYHCQFCSGRFSQPNNLDRHVRLQHST